MFYNFLYKEPQVVFGQIDHLELHLKKHIDVGDEKKIREYVLRSFDSFPPVQLKLHPGYTILKEAITVLKSKFGYKFHLLPDENIEMLSGRNTVISTKFSKINREEYPEVAKNMGFAIKHMPHKVMDA